MEDIEINEEPKCVHNWKIGPTTKSWARGKCRECGEEKNFIANFYAAIALKGKHSKE